MKVEIYISNNSLQHATDYLKSNSVSVKGKNDADIRKSIIDTTIICLQKISTITDGLTFPIAGKGLCCLFSSIGEASGDFTCLTREIGDMTDSVQKVKVDYYGHLG